MVDAGPIIDLDAGSDGGTQPPFDAGTPDAGTFDSGVVVVDSGVRIDAGMTVDAGLFPPFRTCAPPGTRRLVKGGVSGPTSAPTSCQKPVGSSSLKPGPKLSLGTHRVNETLTFNVPPSVGGLTVVQQAVNATSTVTVSSRVLPNASAPHLLTMPSGMVLFDDTVPPPFDGEQAFVWYQAPSDVTGVLTIPATTPTFRLLNGGTLPTGDWSVTVNDYAAECANIPGLCTAGASDAGVYTVEVLLRRGPVPSTGTIDLAFYLVTLNLTATDAMTDLDVKRMLDTLATIYGRAGLCLGTVTFYDVPGWARVKYATGVKADEGEACDDLNQMFTLSKSGENTLNIFFVDSIGQSSGGSTTIVGVDGAIPGPSSVGGTVKSGAVVNIASLKSSSLCRDDINVTLCGPDEVAYITAHEGGHWLGLYHTTEHNGLSYDPLSDSPKCTCSTTCVSVGQAARCCDFNTFTFPNGQPCTDPITSITGDACHSTSRPECAGADHLMFWVIDSNSVGRFSDEQSAVMRANPLVQ